MRLPIQHGRLSGHGGSGPRRQGFREKPHAGPAWLPAAGTRAPSPVPQRPRDTGSPDLRGHAHRPGPRSPGAVPAAQLASPGPGAGAGRGRGDSLTSLPREAPRGLWTSSRSPGAATAAQAGQTRSERSRPPGSGGSKAFGASAALGAGQTPSLTVPSDPSPSVSPSGEQDDTPAEEVPAERVTGGRRQNPCSGSIADGALVL